MFVKKARRRLFFTRFPKIEYEHHGDSESKIVTDIITAFRLNKLPSTKSLVFQTYTIKDTDTPEHLCDVLYRDPHLYWTLLISNEIVDPFVEWVMEGNTLNAYAELKYKDGIPVKKADGTVVPLLLSEGSNGIHHFIDVTDNEKKDPYNDKLLRDLYDIDPESIGENIRPITNLDYEYNVNFKNRVITIISPEYMNRFVNDYSDMFEDIS